MMYQASKLSRVIAEQLDESKIIVWDVLLELGYEAQELTTQDIAKWRFKVEDELNKTRKNLHMIY